MPPVRLAVIVNNAAAEYNTIYRAYRPDDEIVDDDGNPVALGGGAGGGTTETVLNLKLLSDLPVVGSVGSFSNGDVIPAGTSLDAVLRGMLRQRVLPTYVAPALSLAGTGTVDQEAGSVFSPVLTPSFTQNDGGARTAYRLKRNGTTIGSTYGAITDTGVTMPVGNLTYLAEVDYAQGPVKNDSLGEPYATGQIAAGMVTASKVYRGLRRSFFGIGSAFDTSAAIRALASNVLNLANGGTMTTGAVSGTTMVWAYPATLNAMTRCMMNTGFDFDITSDVTAQANVTVMDASGANGIAYRVYTYTVPVAFNGAVFAFKI